MDDGVELSTQVDSVEGGGDINLAVSDTLTLRNGSFINAESTNSMSDDGGNINILATSIRSTPKENSDIIANAAGENRGNITLIFTNGEDISGFNERSGTTLKLRDNNSNDISASSELEEQFIDLNSLLFDPNQNSNQESDGGLNELADDSINSDGLIAGSCIARSSSSAEGNFTISGLSGLPPQPGTHAVFTFPIGEVQGVPADTAVSEDTTAADEWQLGDAIIEPDGVYQLADGRLFLDRQCEFIVPQERERR